MITARILNTHEKKDILGMAELQWGAELKKEFSDKVMLLSAKDKVYLLSRDFERIDDKNLRIDTAGLYFAELIEKKGQKDKVIRLSMEGSQIVGSLAKKNVIELDGDEAALWMKGEDMAKEADAEGFVLLKTKNDATGKYDFLGCGRYNKAESILYNYVPKARRVQLIPLPVGPVGSAGPAGII